MQQFQEKDVLEWLDQVDEVNENPWYKRGQLEKYIASRMPGMFFYSLEDNGSPAAVAVMSKQPEGAEDCWLVAQLSSFKKGFGEKLLRRLTALYSSLWLSVDYSAGPKLEEWYDGLMPQLGWQKFICQNRWQDGKELWTFWLKAKNEEAKRQILAWIENRQ